MRSITVETSSVGPARSLYNALIDFHPELVGSEDDGYRVSVELGSSERRVLDVLGVIEDYVAGEHRPRPHDRRRSPLHDARCSSQRQLSGERRVNT
jgi:hypothetical protein